LLRDDYREVGIPMLPVVKGVAVTVRGIATYAWLTVLVSLLGVLVLPSGGWLYGLLVIPFNARLLQQCHRLSKNPDDGTAAKGVFRWSIFYLFGICLLLLARSPQGTGIQLGELMALLPPLQGL
jgi:protoheme IX farnesyltransferase